MTAQPLIGIIMGSDSDLPTMRDAAAICKRFDVPYEVRVVSAHRTPADMADYATSAHTRGLKVIIAGAGNAAHLPGMVAAYTPLPVIGVPVKGRALDGFDSLLSIVQMPNGIPVAAHDPALLARMSAYKAELAAASRAKNEHLGEV